MSWNIGKLSKQIAVRSSSLNYQKSTAINEIAAFRTRNNSADSCLSIKTLMEQILHLGTEKKDFVSLEESKLKARFEKMGILEVCFKEYQN